MFSFSDDVPCRITLVSCVDDDTSKLLHYVCLVAFQGRESNLEFFCKT